MNKLAGQKRDHSEVGPKKVNVSTVLLPTACSFQILLS